MDRKSDLCFEKIDLKEYIFFNREKSYEILRVLLIIHMGKIEQVP